MCTLKTVFDATVMGTLLELANKWNVRENIKQYNLRVMQSNNLYTVLHARYMSEVLDQFILCQTCSSSMLRLFSGNIDKGESFGMMKRVFFSDGF